MIAYFGFGSLVNQHSLRTDAIAIAPARLKGWRRHWQARPSGFEGKGGEIALLSVHEDAASEIDGVVIIDRVENLAALDERERHYRRVALKTDMLQLCGSFVALGTGRKEAFSQEELAGMNLALERAFIYQGEEAARAGYGSARLLQSYLDVVLSGFQAMHGDEGRLRFIESTDGFGREMIAERNNPVYPRAVRLSPGIYRQHDELLKGAGVKFIDQ